MTAQPNETALLRFQLAEAQQANANMQAFLSQRWAENVQDFVNGLAVMVEQARGGNVNSKKALEQLFTNLDGAREAASSKLVLPPGAKSGARPVIAQAGGGEVPDDGGPVEAGNVL